MAGKFYIFDFNGQSSSKNSNRAFREKVAAKFLNLLLTDSLPAKIKIALFVGRKIFELAFYGKSSIKIIIKKAD